MKIWFKKYDLNNDLDFFNKVLLKASQDRFELRKSKNNKYYLYDFDDREVIRNKAEVKDIIECQYLENFVSKKEYKRIENILKEMISYDK